MGVSVSGAAASLAVGASGRNATLAGYVLVGDWLLWEGAPARVVDTAHGARSVLSLVLLDGRGVVAEVDSLAPVWAAAEPVRVCGAESRVLVVRFRRDGVTRHGYFTGDMPSARAVAEELGLSADSVGVDSRAWLVSWLSARAGVSVDWDAVRLGCALRRLVAVD